MKIDWKLKGCNILKFFCGKETVIHPETCSKMVYIDHSKDITLKDWITDSGKSDAEKSLAQFITKSFISSDATIEINANYKPNEDIEDFLKPDNSLLLGTISENTINQNYVRVPYAKELFGVPGVVTIGSGLRITDFSNNLVSVDIASDSYYGGIKTGFEETETTEELYLPVQLVRGALPESHGKAFISINKNRLVPVPINKNSGKFLRSDYTWQFPENTTYEIANNDNDLGLIQVLSDYNNNEADVTSLYHDADTIDSANDLFIPIVFNSNNNCHGVSLKLFVRSLCMHPELLRELKSALNSIVDE